VKENKILTAAKNGKEFEGDNFNNVNTEFSKPKPVLALESAQREGQMGPK